MTYWPDFAFSNYAGPCERWFAWRPVRLWNGSLVWMRSVQRRICVVHSHLDPHGGDKFWVYAKEQNDG